jgi:hypothetical protein
LQEGREDFVRCTVLIPRSALDFAAKCGIHLDIQKILLSALAGYLNTFAGASPDSCLPLEESRRMARIIESTKTPRYDFCPFCLMFALEEEARSALVEEYDGCTQLLGLKRQTHGAQEAKQSSEAQIPV